MAIEVEGELQLGSNTVRSGDEHRLAIALRHFKQRTEAAEPAQHTLPQRFLGERLDTLDEFVAGIDINAGITIGESFFRWLSHVLMVPNEACAAAVVVKSTASFAKVGILSELA